MTVQAITVDGCTWALEVTADEPRILDVDLAERAGLKQPRNIRTLIERWREELEDFGTLSQRIHRVRYESRPGVWQEREVIEFWLNEHQTTAILVQLRTPQARRMRRAVVEVFVAYRRGQLVAPATSTAPKRRSVPVLSNTPTLGDTCRSEIKARCTRAARCTRTSVQYIHGCLRKPYRVASVYQIDDAFYERVCSRLERWERGDEALPSRGPRLLKAAAESAQCELPFPKTKRGAS